MRKTRRILGVAAVATALAVVGSTGCITKKVFRKNVEETNTRIQGVESGVEENERRIGDLGKETDQKIASVRQTAEKAVEVGNSALQKAQTAEKLARGKMLWEVTLSDDRVRFSFGQAEVPPEAAAALDDLSNKVRAYDKAVYVEIEGHTDNIGSEEYNLQLGQERAEAVRSYLASKGIPLHAMEVISYGETKPVTENSTPAGRSQNRRVVVRVLE